MTKTEYIFVPRHKRKQTWNENVVLLGVLGALAFILALTVWAKEVRAMELERAEYLETIKDRELATFEEVEERLTEIKALETAPIRPDMPERVQTLITKKQTVKKYYDIPLSEDVQDFLFQVAEEYNVPSGLIVAIMETESRFTADIISRTNDYGLMQINECAHEWLRQNVGVTDLLDPKQNILAGAYILRYHIDYCNGDVRKALMCYACGAGRAEYYFTRGIYETEYTKSLLERADRWEMTIQ